MNAVLAAFAAASTVLAEIDPEKVKPGWVALVIVLLLCAATVLLWRSMNHQLRKVRFDDGSGRGTAPGGKPPGGTAPGGKAAGDGDAAAPTDPGRGEGDGGS